MSITTQIMETIKTQPNLTAMEVATILNAKPQTVKQTLWRLVRGNKVVREKTATKMAKGPQNLFVYKVKDNHAEQITSASQNDASSSIGSQVRPEGGYPPIYR